MSVQLTPAEELVVGLFDEPPRTIFSVADRTGLHPQRVWAIRCKQMDYDAEHWSRAHCLRRVCR